MLVLVLMKRHKLKKDDYNVIRDNNEFSLFEFRGPFWLLLGVDTRGKCPPHHASPYATAREHGFMTKSSRSDRLFTLGLLQ